MAIEGSPRKHWPQCCHLNEGPEHGSYTHVSISVRSSHKDVDRLEKCYLLTCIFLSSVSSTAYAMLADEKTTFVEDFANGFFVSSCILKFFPQFFGNAHRKTAKGISLDSAYLSFYFYLNFFIYELLVTSGADHLSKKLNEDYRSIEGLVFITLSMVLSAANVIQMYYLDGYTPAAVLEGVNKLSDVTVWLISIYSQVQIVFIVLIFFNQTSYNQAWLICLLVLGAFLGAIRIIPQLWSNYMDTLSNNVSFASVTMELLGSIACLVMIVDHNRDDHRVTGMTDCLIRALGTNPVILLIACFTLFSDICLLLQISKHNQESSKERQLSQDVLWHLQSALIQSDERERAELVLPSRFISLDEPLDLHHGAHRDRECIV